MLESVVKIEPGHVKKMLNTQANNNNNIWTYGKVQTKRHISDRIEGLLMRVGKIEDRLGPFLHETAQRTEQAEPEQFYTGDHLEDQQAS